MAITLFTDLDPDERVRRLGATGWTEEPKPRKWQLTATDRNVFRMIDGATFRLYRRKVMNPRGGIPTNFFFGELHSWRTGTRITGYYGNNDPPGAWIAPLTIVGGVLALIAVMFERWDSQAVAGLLLLAVIAIPITVLVVVWANSLTSKHTAKAEEYFARFLVRALEARPAAARMDRR